MEEIIKLIEMYPNDIELGREYKNLIVNKHGNTDELCRNYPNYMELGKAVRRMYSK